MLSLEEWGRADCAAASAAGARWRVCIELGGDVSMSASEIDAIVGQRLRERREELGLSQSRLGRHLGLTFSQIQKYEKGANRIGAGRLWLVAQYLGVSPKYFFDAVDERAADRAGRPRNMAQDDIRTLSEAFAAIGDEDTRRSVLALVRSLGGQEQMRRILR